MASRVWVFLVWLTSAATHRLIELEATVGARRRRFDSRAADSHGQSRALGSPSRARLTSRTMEIAASDRAISSPCRASLPVLVAILVVLCLLTPGTALGSSASTVSWGLNTSGQLGNGTEASSAVPVVVGRLSEATAISGGGHHSLARLSNGDVLAWGANEFGQLGDGTDTGPIICVTGALACSTSPVEVADLTEVKAVSAGGDHSLALLSDGVVKAWGDNEFGQLGDGTTTNRDEPVQVQGLSKVVAISAGGDHSLALLSDGMVMAWGDNEFGQLGDGATTNRDLPVEVKGLSGVIAISAGGDHSLALLSSGVVKAWGDNEFGQLGDGTTTNRDEPVEVKGLSEVVAAISAGRSHSLALQSNGTVRAWGDNAAGQLGDGTTTNRAKPVEVKGATGVTEISGGGEHSLGLLSNGTAIAWGEGDAGELGDGAAGKGIHSSVPVEVANLDEVTAVSAGGFHDLALGAPVPPLVAKASPSTGAGSGGTPVIITGTNFTGATAVKFGSVNASFALESATQITAASPPGTGTVDITVTTPDGTSVLSSADRFTYGPTVTKVEPATGTAAGGTHVRITGTSLSGAVEVRFGTMKASILKPGTESELEVESPPGSGTVEVTVATAAGASPLSTADRYTYGPTVTAVEPNSGAAAGGITVTIAGTGFTGATEVRFGPTRARFKLLSETEIEAEAPPGCGTAEVIVTTPIAASPPGPGAKFTYGPNVTKVEPNHGSAGGGTKVTITGCGLIGITEVKFGSAPAPKFKIMAETELEAESPPGTSGPVDVTATTGVGTSATSSSDHFTYGPTVTKVEPSTGPAAGGTKVKITGTGFNGATEVKFGANEAAFKIITESEIEAISPEGGGTVDVTVTTPVATSPVSLSDKFTYGPAGPAVTAVSPSVGTGGTTVKITGTGFNGAMAVAFGTNSASRFKVISETEIEAEAPPQGCTATVDVTVTTPIATSPLSAADRFGYSGGIKVGHPELFSNGCGVSIGKPGLAQIGYGDFAFESSQLPGGVVECAMLFLATGYNGGTPVRAQGQILSWVAQGHAPTETHHETASECRGESGGAWWTAESAIKPVSGTEATRGATSTPWNYEVECSTRAGEKVAIIKIGVPTSRTESERKAAEERACKTEAAEKAEAEREISAREGCYRSEPPPAGCIAMLSVDPAESVELAYGGTLRAKVVNGVGNGLDQTRWEFEGAKAGELQCSFPAGCTGKGTIGGPVKDQGYEAVQLITYK